jgi:hypothetical protein
VVREDVLEQVDSEDLSVIAVWMPVLGSDNADEGIKAESLLPDDRATHYWDEDRNLGNLYGRLLTLPRNRKLAWDIYFVYAPGVRWEDQPPLPTFWMHRLGNDERFLDGTELRQAVQRLLPVEEPALESLFRLPVVVLAPDVLRGEEQEDCTQQSPVHDRRPGNRGHVQVA